MCEPLTIASTALSGMSQIAGHQAENQAIAGRDRAKLRNFEEANKQYDREVMFDRAQYRNEMQLEDIKQDDVYRAMVDQWTEDDQKLDRLFAESDQKIEKAIIKMYENDYAGTQTGRTAGRLAARSAKKLGQEKSEILHNLMTAKKETKVSKDVSQKQASMKSRDLYEQVRFAPIHGPTPIAPELEPPKSSASLLLGLGQTAVGGLQSFKSSDTFKSRVDEGKSGWTGR